ncbi:MAG: ubiquinone/menaquinone biosynthesis methyltransferase [Candidatus Omnitrophica bacterium]|nr:ubiquinone/menaquinone biosynthesis methyltransferase [Candidatus Omnitrophota bacterium]
MNDNIAKSDSPLMFNAIARRYDFLNFVLSFGMVVSWRRKIADNIPRQKNIKVLDLATGTAEAMTAILRRSSCVERVVGIDLSQNMLLLGQKKVFNRGFKDKAFFLKADAQNLPFLSRSFDVVTVSFGLRNMPDFIKALIETERVLVPGGQIMALEFSQPAGLVKVFYLFYLAYVVPLVGFLLTGNFRAYHYLSRTAQKFPYGERFVSIMKQVGFATVRRVELSWGAATLYIAEKS